MNKKTLLHLLKQSPVEPFIPKFILCLLEGYSQKQLAKDTFAGITVGIIALPLAMAFAIGAGLDPDRGIQTAIVAGFLSSVFGGSRFLIAGPEGAFVVMMFTIIQKFGVDGLLCATMTASILLIFLALMRCGSLVRYISYPVVVGFTTGLGIVLLLSQLQDFFGITPEKNPVDVLDRLFATIQILPETNSYAVAIGVATIILIIALRKISPRFPSVIVALIMVTAVSYYFSLPTETIQSKFGVIHRNMPCPKIPNFSLEMLRKTFPDALSIALLCAIEALLTCVIADRVTGTRHKSNCELLGQGIANFGSACFGGLPSTGAIARTSANIQLDAQTPIAGIIHSITLLILLLAFAPLASQIPLAALSAVLVVVSVRMIEFDQIRHVLTSSLPETITMFATMLITIFININTAVEVGVFLSIIIFLKKSSETTTGRFLTEEKATDDASGSWKMNLPSDTFVYEIEGPLFFAVTDMLSEIFQLFHKKPKTLIVRMRSVPFIDATGVEALRRFFTQCEQAQIALFFVELRPSVIEYLQRTTFFDTVSPDHIFPSIKKALLHKEESS